MRFAQMLCQMVVAATQRTLLSSCLVIMATSRKSAVIADTRSPYHPSFICHMASMGFLQLEHVLVVFVMTRVVTMTVVTTMDGMTRAAMATAVTTETEVSRAVTA